MTGLLRTSRERNHARLMTSDYTWRAGVLSRFGRVRLLVTPWTAACQAPLCMGFSRQESWSGWPCLPPGDLPHPGIEPQSPALKADSLPTEAPGEPSDLACWYPNPLQAAPRLWPVTPSTCSSSQRLHPWAPRGRFSCTCFPTSEPQKLDSVHKQRSSGGHPLNFPPPGRSDYICESFRFSAHPPSLRGFAILSPFYLRSNLFLPSRVPPRHINHLKYFVFLPPQSQLQSSFSLFKFIIWRKHIHAISTSSPPGPSQPDLNLPAPPFSLFPNSCFLKWTCFFFFLAVKPSMNRGKPHMRKCWSTGFQISHEWFHVIEEYGQKRDGSNRWLRY